MDKKKNVLIDPSLLVAKNSMIKTFDYIHETEKLGVDYQFYLPMSFLRLLSKPRLKTDSPGIRFFLRNAELADTKELYGLIKQYSEIIFPFEIDHGLTDEHSWMYKGLRKELDSRGELLDEDLLRILFEEWVFMQERSWVVSRIKKPFNRFISAGAICMQFSQRILDTRVRRTLEGRADYYLNNWHRLRALGKWVGVGIAAPLIGRYAGWQFSGLVGLFMMLFDP